MDCPYEALLLKIWGRKRRIHAVSHRVQSYLSSLDNDVASRCFGVDRKLPETGGGWEASISRSSSAILENTSDVGKSREAEHVASADIESKAPDSRPATI